MGIEQLSDEQPDTFESNYRKAKKTDGGKYSLSEILLERFPASLNRFLPKGVP
jgi:hypothetical protein